MHQRLANGKRRSTAAPAPRWGTITGGPYLSSAPCPTSSNGTTAVRVRERGIMRTDILRGLKHRRSGIVFTAQSRTAPQPQQPRPQ